MPWRAAVPIALMLTAAHDCGGQHLVDEGAGEPDRPGPRVLPPPREPETLSPADYCARIAALAARKDPSVALRCDCFEPLYEAMRDDNAAYYACSARCAEASADLDEMHACEMRDRCARLTAPPRPRRPGGDARIESYCARMTSIDDPGPEPRLGMWTCAQLARMMKHDSQAAFDCSYDCAMASASQADYQACVVKRACHGPSRGEH
jgi:hypothetical protein